MWWNPCDSGDQILAGQQPGVLWRVQLLCAYISSGADIADTQSCFDYRRSERDDEGSGV